VVKWTIFQRPCRLVVRFGTRGFMYWMVVWSLCLLGLLGSFTSRGLGLGVGMSGVAGRGGGWLFGVWVWLGGAGVGAWRAWGGAEPDVPERGLGALARGWGFGVCGARGPSGQGSRLPH